MRNGDVCSLGRFCRPGLIVNIRMNVAGKEDYDCKILHQQRKLFMSPLLDDDGGQYAASC